MADPGVVGLSCGYIVGVHTEDSWKGFEKPCGRTQGTRKDPRSPRYDDGFCPDHWHAVFGEAPRQARGHSRGSEAQR